ncbi:hypothetical protein [Pseudonocardia aurantiaca]|uniref:Uncharacterized protein n=1 Tax=Pseudonocardia aurantiaca TaxID=75290 RepID=A0ABW4FHY7_9PSEU
MTTNSPSSSAGRRVRAARAPSRPRGCSGSGSPADPAPGTRRARRSGRPRPSARRTRSTVDLAGPGWALVVAGDVQPWEHGVAGAPVSVPAHRLDADCLPAGSALLLRPDQVVAWRGTDPAAPAGVVRTLLGLTGRHDDRIGTSSGRIRMP